MNDDELQEAEEEQQEESAVEVAEEGPEEAATAELRLTRSGQPTGDRFRISGRAVIGRFDPNVGPVDVDLGPIEESVYISRKHAELRHEDGKWFLKDLGSSNGTFVLEPGEDYSRIEEEAELFDGQELAFGNARFTFHIPAETDEADTDDAKPEASDESSAEQVAEASGEDQEEG